MIAGKYGRYSKPASVTQAPNPLTQCVAVGRTGPCIHIDYYYIFRAQPPSFHLKVLLKVLTKM